MSRDQSWNAASYRHHAGFVPQLGRPLLDLLAPKAGERILDLGCGDGTLTLELAATGAAVTAIDSAPDMVRAARGRGLDARLGDATRLAWDGEFDAVFSNAVLHWVKDADAAIDGVWRALKPGGRFAGELGGHGNVAAIVTALTAVLAEHGVAIADVHPWYYPTAAAYRRSLERRGFAVTSIELIPRPTPLPTGMAGWLDTFAGPLLAAVPEEDRVAARERAVELLRPALCDDEGGWTADYLRLRFAALKPV